MNTTDDGKMNGPGTLSVFELLLHALQTYADREEARRLEYQRMADSGGDELVQLLTSLVAQDGRDHHDLLRRMAASLGDASVGRVERLPAIPSPAWQPTPDELVTVETMIYQERASGRSSERLARQHAGVYSGLFSMLLDVMALDSEKHQRVLGFILRRMKEQRKVSTFLVGRDHRLNEQLWALSTSLAGDQTAAESVAAASAALTGHIYLEEDLLLPQLEEGRFDDIAATATREHGEMVRLMDAVARLAWASGDITSAHEPASHLWALFEGHRQAAEFVLYGALDALPEIAARAQLIEQLEAAEPPRGWLCRAQRRQPTG